MHFVCVFSRRKSGAGPDSLPRTNRLSDCFATRRSVAATNRLLFNSLLLRLVQLIDGPRPSTSRLGRYAQDERGSQMPLILSVGREEAEVEGRPVSRQPFTPGSIGRRARRSADPCVTAFVQQARMGGITATHAPALAHRAPPRHVTPRHARPSRTRRPGRCPDVGPGPPSRRRCPPPASTKLLCQHGAQCDAVRTRLAPCRATAKV